MGFSRAGLFEALLAGSGVAAEAGPAACGHNGHSRLHAAAAAAEAEQARAGQSDWCPSLAYLLSFHALQGQGAVDVNAIFFLGGGMVVLSHRGKGLNGI